MRTFYCFLLLVVSALLLCVGCAGTTQTQMRYTSTFDQAQAEQMMRPGKNTIVLNCNSDSAGACAGLNAFLIPATDRAAEFVKFHFGSAEGGQISTAQMVATTERIANHDQALGRLTAKPVSATDGTLAFNKIGDGDFYVAVANADYVYAEKVTVSGGETKKMALADLTKEGVR